MTEQKRSPIVALPALLLVVVSLWEVCATRRDAAAVPGDDAWERAAKIVRAAFRPGDLIVFAPGWEDPVGRLHLGDLMSIEMAARDDAAPYARIWELSTRGAHASEVDGLALVEERADEVTVRRYEQTPAQIVSDLRDHVVAPATLELAEVGFAPHRCLQVTPQPGKEVPLAFPQTQLGTKLVGYVGLADVFTRRDIRAPGHLVVKIGGAEVARVDPGVDDGWVGFSIPTTPGVADIVVTASADAPQRKICFSITGRK
jgi:hypothetical protein